MFLHIGNSVSVRMNDIIGMFDLDTATVSKITKDFIKNKNNKNEIIYQDEDIPRSFILMKDKKVILSHISTVGLENRSNYNLNGKNENG